MPHIYLQGLKLANYRGIGSVEQTMAPFKTFNFFIGANNAGKSGVLSFISKHMPVRLLTPHGNPSLSKLLPLELEVIVRELKRCGKTNANIHTVGVHIKKIHRRLGPNCETLTRALLGPLPGDKSIASTDRDGPQI